MRTILNCFIAALLVCFELNAAEISSESVTDAHRIVDPTISDTFTIEKEISMGEIVASDFEKSVLQISDPDSLAFINRIGRNLTISSESIIKCQFRILDSEEMDALAILGGHIYVTAGLITAAGSEAELAGVMAHAVAHVEARHTAGLLKNARDLKAAAIPDFPWSWSGLKISIPDGINFESSAAAHRAFEVEADRLAVQYLWKAGYDPNAYVTMLQKLLNREQGPPGLNPTRIPPFMPSTKDRIAACEEETTHLLPKENYILTTSEFERVKMKLLAISKAQKEEAGDTANTPMPERPVITRKPQ